MIDFTEHVSFDVLGQKDATLYEIYKANTQVQGAYTCHRNVGKGIDIFVLGPQNQVVFSKRKL